MNAQARQKHLTEWHSYGDVSMLEAIKSHAILTSKSNNLCEATWVIECRHEDEPEVIDEFEVQVTLRANRPINTNTQKLEN